MFFIIFLSIFLSLFFINYLIIYFFVWASVGVSVGAHFLFIYLEKNEKATDVAFSREKGKRF